MKKRNNNKIRLFNVMAVILLGLGNFVPATIGLAETLQDGSPGVNEEVLTKEDLETDTESNVENSEPVSAPEEDAQDDVASRAKGIAGEAVDPQADAQKDEIEKEKKKITIIGTSDVHGNMWDWSYEDGTNKDLGFAKISSIVNKARNENPNTIVVDSGDTIQGTILTDDVYNIQEQHKSEIHPMMAAMNYIKYDSMSLGNHEFNFGIDLIKKIDDDADFPLLSANTYVRETKENLVKPYKIQMVDGVKVAILGMTIPHVPLWDGEKVASLEFTALNTEARKQVDILNNTEKPDIIVAAIHAGLDNNDPKAAARNVILEVPEIDAFVLGHDHREFAEKIKDGKGQEKPVAAVKDTGSGAVKIDLNLEKEEKWKVASSEVGIEHSANYQADEDFKNATKKYHDTVVNYIQGTLGNATGDFLPKQEVKGIPEAQLRPTALISLINRVQLEMIPADLSLSALFKEDSDLKAGPVTYANLFDIYKFPNTLIKTKINGKQLKQYMEDQGNYYLQSKKGDVTVGFNEKMRIYLYDMLDGEGVHYKIDISKPVGERITELKVKGKDVKETDEFSIVLNNYRFSQLSEKKLVSGEVLEDSDPDTLRSGIGAYIEKKKNIDPEVEITNNFEIIGTNFNKKHRDYVIEQIEAGNIVVPRSADGRTPNVKALNMYDLVKEGKVPAEMLEDEGNVSFTIMHTNDMHGRFEYDKGGKAIGLAKVKTYKDEKNPTLLVDAGDALQGLPISNHTDGADMVKAMNAVGYDAMTVGNHEFDFGIERALKLQTELNFPIVSANVYKEGKPVFEPYIIKEKEGINFALIGLTTPETSVKTHPNNVQGVTFKKPVPVAKEVIDGIGDKADVFVFMTHLGIDETTVQDERGDNLARELSAAYPDKKIFIIDGHSHTELPAGKKEGHVLMGQTGNHLNNIGWITAEYNPEANLAAQLITFADFETIEQNPEVKAIADQARANYDKDMGDIVIQNNPVLFNGQRENVRARETNLGNIIGDALYQFGVNGGFDHKTDFAVVNGGGIRQDIKVGPVTKGDIVGVMPFGNIISQIKVSGQAIYDMFEHSLRSIPVLDENGAPVLDENGLPKLGANGGFLQVSDSVKVIYDSNKTGANPAEKVPGQRVLNVQIKDRTTGEFVDVDKAKEDYYIATNDFLAAGGDGFTMLGGPREERDSLDTVFLNHLLKSTEEQLKEYQEEFPGSRIISMKEEDYAKTQPLNLAELEKTVEIANQKVAKQYTAETWKPFEVALKEAADLIAKVEGLESGKVVLFAAENEVTQEEINKANAKLVAAMNGLVAVAKNDENANGNTNGNSNSNSNQNSNSTINNSNKIATKKVYNGNKLPQTGEKKSNNALIGLIVIAGVSGIYVFQKRKKNVA